MIRSGTTSFAEMYLHMDTSADAICGTGMRANLSRSPVDFLTDGQVKAIEAFEECRSYFGNWHGKGEGRIKVYLEVHSTYLFDEESLRRAAALAKELRTGIHIHLLETAKEREDSLKKYGMSPVEICAETGILDVPVIGAHLVHISDADIALLRKYSVKRGPQPNEQPEAGKRNFPCSQAACGGYQCGDRNGRSSQQQQPEHV